MYIKTCHKRCAKLAFLRLEVSFPPLHFLEDLAGLRPQCEAKNGEFFRSAVKDQEI